MHCICQHRKIRASLHRLRLYLDQENGLDHIRSFTKKVGVLLHDVLGTDQRPVPIAERARSLNLPLHQIDTFRGWIVRLYNLWRQEANMYEATSNFRIQSYYSSIIWVIDTTSID